MVDLQLPRVSSFRARAAAPGTVLLSSDLTEIERAAAAEDEDEAHARRHAFLMNAWQ
jgi:hypothetical protein